MYNPKEYRDDMIAFLKEEYNITIQPWQRDLIEKMTKDFANLTYQCYKEKPEEEMNEKKKKMNSAPTLTAITTTSSFADNWIFPPVILPSYGAAHTHTFSLGTVEVAPASEAIWVGKQQEGNNPMNYATATVQAGTTETQDQRKYLSGRLTDVFYEKLRPLEAQFGLTDDERPNTPKELKKRLAEGKFVIKGLPVDGEDEDEDDDQYFYGGWTNMIRWRDPAKKADADGYSAALKELQALQLKTQDIIKIDEPKVGLDAIKALEAWTPTGAAN